MLTSCSEINNAIATSYKGVRYILYDKAFMRLINSRTNDWSNLAILAHEVGHHINGHSIDLLLAAGGVVEPKTLATRRKQELEADKFAGFIMAKLGASLNQALSFTEIFVEKEDTYSTHPSKSKRVNAVRIGYNKAGGTSRANNSYVVDNSNMSVEQYYNRGKKRVDSKDYYGAIQDFNQAIRIKPDYELAYFYRAFSKYESQDYSGAVRDFSRYIELNPDDAAAYYNRGLAKNKLKDYYGAIADYSKAIEIKPDDPLYYSNRGVTKENAGDLRGACADWRRAASLGHTNSAKWVKDQCGGGNSSVNTVPVPLAKRRGSSVNTFKPNTMNLNNIKGFILVANEYSGWPLFNKTGARHTKEALEDNFEMSSFEFYTKKKDIKKFSNKSGYISINIKRHQTELSSSSNFITTWIFRDHNRKIVYSVQTTNIYVTEMLSAIGITTY